MPAHNVQLLQFLQQLRHKTMTANVIPLPGLRLPNVGVAATCGQGNRVSGSRSDIWFCPAYGPDGQQRIVPEQMYLNESGSTDTSDEEGQA